MLYISCDRLMLLMLFLSAQELQDTCMLIDMELGRLKKAGCLCRYFVYPKMWICMYLFLTPNLLYPVRASIA